MVKLYDILDVTVFHIQSWINPKMKDFDQNIMQIVKEFID